MFFSQRNRLLFIFLILILVFNGCGYGLRTRQKEILEIQNKKVSALPLLNLYRDFKGAIHVHTYLSHDSQGEIKDIVGVARHNKIDFVILTDHNNRKVFEEQPKGFINGVLIIGGVEIIKDKTDVLAVAPKNFIEKGALDWPEIIAELRRQKSFIIVAHADYLYSDWQIDDYDGLEVYDIFDDVLTEKIWRWPGLFFKTIFYFQRYPEAVFLEILDRPFPALKKWDKTMEKKRVIAVAGNDSHQNVKFFGLQLDPYWLSFKMVSTHILAEELSEESVLSALKSGRAYISFGIVNGNDNFQFYGQDKNNRLIMMGEEAPMENSVTLFVKISDKGKIRMFRDGSLVFEDAANNSLELAVILPGVYRVEVEREIGNNWFPWIISNPIYIK